MELPVNRLDPFAAQAFRGNGFVPAGGASREVVKPSALNVEERIALADAQPVETVAAGARATQVGLGHSRRARWRRSTTSPWSIAAALPIRTTSSMAPGGIRRIAGGGEPMPGAARCGILC